MTAIEARPTFLVFAAAIQAAWTITDSFGDKPMRALSRGVWNFIENEDGPTAVEYAVMLALIIVLCIVVIRQVGTSASKTFSTADSALQ